MKHFRNLLAALFAAFLTFIIASQHVSAAPVHELVTALLRYLPDEVHLILGTRIDPPLPLARLRAHDELTEIRTAELHFNQGETQEFLHRSRTKWMMSWPLS